MKRKRADDPIETECSACNGTGFPAVEQPVPGRKIYPPPCVRCKGSGRIKKPGNRGGPTLALAIRSGANPPFFGLHRIDQRDHALINVIAVPLWGR